MILFEQDWHDASGRRTAWLDTGTKNASFIRMMSVLSDPRLGVQNNKFFMSIHDRDLIGHDPHDLKDPSLELRLRIGREIKINPWYFVRNVVRIPASGGDPIQYELHRANLALTWCYYNNIDYYGVQPRQTFKTMSTTAIIAHVTWFFGYNVKFFMLTKDNKLRLENVSRLKEIRDALPDYLLEQVRTDMDNREGLEYSPLFNKYLTYVAASDLAGADKLGRGMTTPTGQIDEAGFIDNFNITYPVLMASTLRAREDAARNKKPHSNILTTTAARIDSESGRYAYNLLKAAMPMTEKLYDCKDHAEARAMIDNNSTNGIVNGTFSYLQLGKTHAWLQKAIRTTNATPDEVARDFLNEWKSGSDIGILSEDVIKRLRASQAEPSYIEVIDGKFTIRWFLEERIVNSTEFRTSTPIIFGMDASEMVGRDFTTLVGIDPRNMRVLFTFRCNESTPGSIAVIILRILLRYTRSVFIPERKSFGGAITIEVAERLIMRDINPLTRIYNVAVQNRRQPEFQELDIYDKHLATSGGQKYLGFVTTEKSRPFLYKMALTRSMSQNADKVLDQILINELIGLTSIDGRIDHNSKGHDDMVIAYLLACWFVYSANNVGFYGLTNEDILSAVSQTGKDVDPAYLQAQIEVRRQVRNLDDSIERCTDDILRQNLIVRRNQLARLVDGDLVLDPVNAQGARELVGEVGEVFGKIPMDTDYQRSSQSRTLPLNKVISVLFASPN